MKTKTQQNQRAVRVGNKRQKRRIVAKKRVYQTALKTMAEKLRAIREHKARRKADAEVGAARTRRLHQLRKNAGNAPVKLNTSEKKASSFLRKVFGKKS